MRLEDYSIGSPESRAAARALVQYRRSKQKRVQIVHGVRGPWRGEGDEPPDLPKASPWRENVDGTLFRMVYVPHVWIGPKEAIPVCPGCSRPYRKQSEYPNYPWIGYQANCVNEHVPDFSSLS